MSQKNWIPLWYSPWIPHDDYDNFIKTDHDIKDFWQRGSIFICLLIVGEKFDTGWEPPAWFRINSSTICRTVQKIARIRFWDTV